MLALTSPLASAADVTVAVLQVAEVLGLYQAELARILMLRCSDIADLYAGRVIEKNSMTYNNALLFIGLYRWLYSHYAGDDVMICHWLRRYDRVTGRSPFIRIFDHGELIIIVNELNNSDL